MSSLSHPTAGVLGGPIGLGSAGILGPLVVLETPSTPTDAPLGSATWLLDLQVGGRVLRYATREVVVTDVRGREYLYRSGLADFEMMLDGEQEAQGFLVSDRGIDWPQIVADGENLDRATAILRHWEPGELLEGAMVVLSGEVTEPEYADPLAPDVFVGTIQAGIEVDRLYPSEQMEVSAATWPRDIAVQTYDESIDGAYYPTIFGYPGEGDTATTTPTPCVPGLLVNWQPGALASSYLLIGWGELDVAGGNVYVRDITGPDDPAVGWEQEMLATTTDTDDLGQKVTLVTVPTGAGVNGDLGHEYYVGFSRTTGWGGGTTIPGGSRPIQTLQDVALFVQRYSGRTVDIQAQEAEAPHFEGYRIDGYLNDRLTLLPWFESQILPLFPMVRARTQKGLHWRFVNWWASEKDAKTHLDADKGQVVRASALKTTLDQVRNRFSIGFQYAAGKVGARRTLTNEAEAVVPWWESPLLLADDRIVGSPTLARSQSLYGLREEAMIEAQFVWSQTTAAAILHYRAVRDAFPRRTVMYEGRADELRWLQKGDVVTVTDSGAALSRAVALVDSVRLSSSRRVAVSLSLLDPRRLSG